MDGSNLVLGEMRPMKTVSPGAATGPGAGDAAGEVAEAGTGEPAAGTSGGAAGAFLLE